jgi:hypothetical protein
LREIAEPADLQGPAVRKEAVWELHIPLQKEKGIAPQKKKAA